MLETSRFRPDIEGMRAIAVLAVLLFHAGIPGFGGGFTGVDVFNVISGFLITGLLLREMDAARRVNLPTFYFRRVRRLLPAALLVIAVTLIASWLVLSSLRFPDVAGDAAAASLYSINYRFAISATDYLASTADPSPLQHYWSLAVEEQFYLIWPLLIIVATRIVGLRRVGLVLAVVTAGSFLWSLVVTDASAPWAFFSLPTRAWELGAGALVAAGVLRLPKVLPGGAHTLTAIAGLCLVISGVMLIDTSVAYPGFAALIPTVGTVLLIIGCTSGTGPIARGLGSRVPRSIGGVSYSLYLWHWPLLILVPIALESDDRSLMIGLLVIAAVLAVLSSRFVEAPFRHGRLAATPARRGVAVGLSASVLLAIGALAAGGIMPDPGSIIAAHPVATHTPHRTLPPRPPRTPSSTPSPTSSPTPATTVSPTAVPTIAPRSVPTLLPMPAPLLSPTAVPTVRPTPQESGQPTDTTPVAGTAGPTPTVAPTSSPTLAPTSSPTLAPTPIPTRAPTPIPTRAPTAPPTSIPTPIPTPAPTPIPTPIATPVPTMPALPAPQLDGQLPDDVTPRLVDARKDLPDSYADGCHLDFASTQSGDCVYGYADSPTTVVLLGDSHAAQWLPTLEALAEERDWRIVSLTKSACPDTDVAVWAESKKRAYRECDAWHQQALARVTAEHPAITFVASFRGYEMVIDGTRTAIPDAPDAWASGMTSFLSQVAAASGRTILIADTPHLPKDPVECLAKHDDLARCAAGPDEAVDPAYAALERTVATAIGADVVTPADWLCDEVTCPLVFGASLVYRDDQHLTASFAETLAPQLGWAIDREP